MKLINLLPKEKQQELRYRRVFQTMLSLIWISLASFLVALLSQLGVKVFLQGQQGRLNQSIENLKQQTGKEENAQIKNQVRQLNDLVADYKALSSGLPKFSKALRAFAPLVPENVKITSMRIDAVKMAIDINGFSPSRELVIKLYDNVVADARDFPDIDYPLENVAKPADISFHFSFNVNADLLK